MSYAWMNLKDNSVRGEILFDALEPYLKVRDCVLDVNCGFSPMAKELISFGCSITGFDINHLPIKHLKKTVPNGFWVVSSDQEAKKTFVRKDVFLLLGITTPLYSIYSKTFLDSTKSLITSNNPRVIMLESADGADQKFYNQTCDWLRENHYFLKEESHYDAEISRASKRHYSIWLSGWSYNYWNKLFREAKDLNAIHERFYKAANIKLSEYKIYQNGTLYTPKLHKLKDRTLSKKILEKKGLKTMLIVGFWDASFMFYMGLKGFKVDGIECYKKAVSVANNIKSELPANLSKRFNFKTGIAEDLSKYGKYDVVVNFCLEHVKNPKQVMQEALNHVKPNGYAFFTPPIHYGCDSPSHLFHFTENPNPSKKTTLTSIHDIIPKDVDAKLFKVKFMAKSPKLNCFIIEIHKKEHSHLT